MILVLVDCVLKTLTTTNRVRYIKINTKLHLEYFFTFPENSIMYRINQDRYHFSPLYAMRFTFGSSIRDMSYNYFLKQQLPMCEVRLNQI